jgi:hypothetical protein
LAFALFYSSANNKQQKTTEVAYVQGLLLASVTASSGPIIRYTGFVPIVGSAHSVFATYFDLN